MPKNNELLDELAYRWQEARDEQRREIPVTELCRDCPELAPELERRLAVLRRFNALCADNSSAETIDEPTVPQAPPASGSIIPPGYEVLGQFQGGMGIVYRVRRLDLNRIEALKMIRSGDFASAREVARFRFEAEATAGLEHPNIVTVYGVGEVNGRPYLALRWIDGVSLDRRLETRGPLTGDEAALIVEKVARAVHYAHQRGILHRDLKPANILLDQKGEPHVSDFGVARRMDAVATMTGENSLVGTPAYMAPEQAAGERKPTAAADVYALGVVLYESLTGRTPFTGRTTFELLKQVIEAEPISPRTHAPTIDAALEAICLKCLEKDPARRYASAQELANDLERFRHGEAVTAQPPGFWDWVGLLLKTRPEPNVKYAWIVSVWCAVLILALNSCIWWLAQREAPALSVLVATGVFVVAMSVVFWWHMLRRFRLLPITERHSLTIGFGYLIVTLILTASYVPCSLTESARTAYAMYPALDAIAGLCFFILGSTNWSRFFPIGLGMMLVVPVLRGWPEQSPLVYGVILSGTFAYWSWIKATSFGRDLPG